MKKSELKNIIKECVKEVIFEEGVLSGIIAEVAMGLQGRAVLQEVIAPATRSVTPDGRPPQSGKVKKQILDAMNHNAYEEAKQKFENPGLFEGTTPIQEGDGRGPLAGVSPEDRGVDITNLPGAHNWAHVANTPK